MLDRHEPGRLLEDEIPETIREHRDRARHESRPSAHARFETQRSFRREILVAGLERLRAGVGAVSKEFLGIRRAAGVGDRNRERVVRV